MCWQLVWHVCRDLSLSVHISQHWGTNHAVRRRSLYARSRYGRRWWAEASNTVTSRHRERRLQVHEESYEGNKIQWASLEGIVLFLFVCSCYWLILVSDIAIFVLKRDVKLQLTNYWLIQLLTSPILTLFFQMILGWPVPSWFFSCTCSFGWVALVFIAWISFNGSVKALKDTQKHWPQSVAWPYPFPSSTRLLTARCCSIYATHPVNNWFI